MSTSKNSSVHKIHALQKFLAGAGGGIASRKLWLSVLCLVLLTLAICLSIPWPNVAGLYGQFVGGVLGVLSIYCGANAVGRWSSNKHIGQTLAGGTEQDASQELPEGPGGHWGPGKAVVDPVATPKPKKPAYRPSQSILGKVARAGGNFLRVWASLVGHSVWSRAYAGSNPATLTKTVSRARQPRKIG